MMANTPPPVSALEAREQVSKALQSAWIRGSAESRPLALVLVGFDKPETAAGVDTLERALRVHCARTHDVVLRRANDEFVAVLPDTPPAGARLVGERIVEAMRTEDTDHTQRVSVGVAVVVPDDHRAPDELLRRAEIALRGARTGGGDRCTGGMVGATAQAPRIGAFAKLRELLTKNKKDPDLKRRTD